MKNYSFVVMPGEEDRIDKLITVKLKGFTRSQVQKLCEKELVFVNDIAVNKKFIVKEGDIVKIDDPIQKELELTPQAIDLDIIYEDEYLAVINKPKGMLVHPTGHQSEDTLVNALIYKYGDKLSSCGEEFRPGIVHRLDKDSSGLLIVAIDNKVHEILSSDLENQDVVRRYQAVVYGNIKEDGIIDLPIARDPNMRVRMAVSDDGRPAVTLYKVIQNYNHFTHVELELKTGRTHQIRVHMAHMGNPIAGDALYGPKRFITELKGQCLHAYELEFTHPISNEQMKFTSELPEYFTKFLQKISN